ncbi:MAG: hypothetical protein QM778_10910 [Myxococcales bacterium]
MRIVWLGLVGVLFFGCAALRDDLRHAEQAFSEARYENAQTWLTDLEPNVPEMDRELRSRFYYLSGMTAFRTGERARAKHYLALCREEAGDAGVGLTPDWRTNLAVTLRDLGAAGGEEAPASSGS